MFKFLSKREKVILSVTGVVILFAVLYNFLISAIIEKYSLLDNQVKIEKARLIKYKQILMRKPAIESKYAALYSNHEVKPLGDPCVTLLSELERLAVNAGVRIIDIRPQADSALGNNKGMSVDLRLDGTMEGFIKFLYDTEKSFNLLTVKRFQLSARSSTSNLEASISIFQSQD